MAWIMAIKGKVANFEGDCKTSNKIEDLKSYKSLSQLAAAQGFVLSTTANYDDDTVAMFIGHDMYPSRHIYQGQTVSLNEDKEPSKELIEKFDELVSEIEEAITHLISTHEGSILSCFD